MRVTRSHTDVKRRLDRGRLSEHVCRIDIDESFRDDKSGGLDIVHTRLHLPERLERLLLTVALATLWRHELGEHVMAQGEKCPSGD